VDLATAGGAVKILHVTDSYLPTIGGIELHIRDLADRQQAAGHDVAVVARSGAAGTPADAGHRTGSIDNERDVHRWPEFASRQPDAIESDFDHGLFRGVRRQHGAIDIEPQPNRIA